MTRPMLDFLGYCVKAHLNCLISGRRKAVYMVLIFGLAFVWRYFRRMSSTQLALVLTLLGLQEAAELGLAAGPLSVDHELMGDCDGDGLAVVLLHHLQRQVHARGDSGRGEQRPVLDEDRVAFDGAAGRHCGEPLAVGPVCRGATPS